MKSPQSLLPYRYHLISSQFMAALPPKGQRHTGAEYEAGRVHGRNDEQPLLGHIGVLQPHQGAGLGPGKGTTGVIRSGRAGSKWKTIKQFPSWKEAKDAMKKGTVEGKWEWASASSSPILEGEHTTGVRRTSTAPCAFVCKSRRLMIRWWRR